MVQQLVQVKLGMTNTKHPPSSRYTRSHNRQAATSTSTTKPNKSRWYLGFQSYGNRSKLIENIARLIQDSSLESYIPLLRVEKKSSRQFYFFLAIEGELIGRTPDKVQELLLGVPELKSQFFNKPIPQQKGLTYADIKSMVGVAHEVIDYTNPIPFQSSTQDKVPDPFTPPTDESNSAADPTYQNLLDWLSSTGSGTWQSFQKVCKILEIEHPQRIARRLKLLGHMEMSPDGKRWCIAPTVLSQIAAEGKMAEFVLCGQQNESLRRRFQQYGRVRPMPQIKGNAPACCRVEIDCVDDLNEIAAKTGTEIYRIDNVAWQVAQLLPNLADWQASLQAISSIIASRYEWQYFDFSSNTFEDCAIPRESGLYQMQVPDRPFQSTVFYNAAKQVWQRGDWYGLRFLARQRQRGGCVAHYDSDHKRLIVPKEQRWPELYERALVLASGLLPAEQQSEQHEWLYYQDIQPELAELLCEKLQVSYQEI